MSFDHLLNEYRRRAGLPPVTAKTRNPQTRQVTEQLPTSHAEKTEGEEMQYINKISSMFQRIHTAAEQGWKETQHPGFAEILKAMGVMESIKEQYQSRERQGETTIELEHEETGEHAEIPLIVRYDVEPTEYEGSHLFYQGGVNVNSVLLADNAMFGGMQVKKGDWFPKEWMEHVGEQHFYADRRNQQDIESYFYDKIGQKLAEQGEDHIPTQRYPRTQ